MRTQGAQGRSYCGHKVSMVLARAPGGGARPAPAAFGCSPGTEGRWGIRTPMKAGGAAKVLGQLEQIIAFHSA